MFERTRVWLTRRRNLQITAGGTWRSEGRGQPSENANGGGTATAAAAAAVAAAAAAAAASLSAPEFMSFGALIVQILGVESIAAAHRPFYFIISFLLPVYIHISIYNIF